MNVTQPVQYAARLRERADKLRRRGDPLHKVELLLLIADGLDLRGLHQTNFPVPRAAQMLAGGFRELSATQMADILELSRQKMASDGEPTLTRQRMLQFCEQAIARQRDADAFRQSQRRHF